MKLLRYLTVIPTVLIVGALAIATARVSPETLAVLAGAVCGVLAAIPTGLVVNRVLRHRAVARKDRAAWCEAQAERAELRAERLETLALRLPAQRHHLVVQAYLERQIAAALHDGDLDRTLRELELSRITELPEVVDAPDLAPALPASTWPGETR